MYSNYSINCAHCVRRTPQSGAGYFNRDKHGHPLDELATTIAAFIAEWNMDSRNGKHGQVNMDSHNLK